MLNIPVTIMFIYHIAFFHHTIFLLKMKCYKSDLWLLNRLFTKIILKRLLTILTYYLSLIIKEIKIKDTVRGNYITMCLNYFPVCGTKYLTSTS